jgi:hypothetical protein
MAHESIGCRCIRDHRLHAPPYCIASAGVHRSCLRTHRCKSSSTLLYGRASATPRVRVVFIRLGHSAVAYATATRNMAMCERFVVVFVYDSVIQCCSNGSHSAIADGRPREKTACRSGYLSPLASGECGIHGICTRPCLSINHVSIMTHD